MPRPTDRNAGNPLLLVVLAIIIICCLTVFGPYLTEYFSNLRTDESLIQTTSQILLGLQIF